MLDSEIISNRQHNDIGPRNHRQRRGDSSGVETVDIHTRYNLTGQSNQTTEK
jgi:hypothetical protein